MCNISDQSVPLWKFLCG